jgi:dihydrofolate reductase
LPAASTTNTRLEREFDPDAVRRLKASADGDLTIGGADLTAHAFAAGLVDECQLVVHPALLGGGKPALPRGTRAGLELLDERRFANGAVYVRYRVTS